MEYLTKEIIRAAIRAQAPVFDSHALIEHLIATEPELYASELAEHEGSKTRPAAIVHSQVSITIRGQRDLVRSGGKVCSADVRGTVCPNERWIRE